MRDWYFIAEQPAPAPHLAHLEACAALRIVLVTVPHVSRSCEHFPDGFDPHLLQICEEALQTRVGTPKGFGRKHAPPLNGPPPLFRSCGDGAPPPPHEWNPPPWCCSCGEAKLNGAPPPPPLSLSLSRSRRTFSLALSRNLSLALSRALFVALCRTLPVALSHASSRSARSCPPPPHEWDLPPSSGQARPGTLRGVASGYGYVAGPYAITYRRILPSTRIRPGTRSCGRAQCDCLP